MMSCIRKFFKNIHEYNDVNTDYKVTMSIPKMQSAFESKYLEMCLNISKPRDRSLQELMTSSSKHPVKIPVDSVRLCGLKNQRDITPDILEHHANSAYPLLHEAVICLYIEFLEYKKKYGSRVEKAVYENMELVELVQRLLDKRAATFCGPKDFYVLLSGESGRGGWELVGTDSEVSPLVLEDCLSYHEMKLSALLALTCYSVFINDGSRSNYARSSAIIDIERHGIVVGIVGPRLSDSNIMEAQEILVSEKQNVIKNGYGSTNRGPKHDWRQMWAKFYGVNFLPLYNEADNPRRSGRRSKSSRHSKVLLGLMFDNEIYAKRISIAAELLLLEAESRAAAAKKSAFLHVVGFGLGVWKVSSHQDKLFLDTFAKCLKDLYPVLHHVSDVNFAWFQANSCGGIQDGGAIGDGDRKIQIHFSNRAPHSKLQDESKLLVVSYAGDGNSLPGNEFWGNQLCSSGDSSNACSTQVSELLNSHINQKMSGANLHVASSKWGVLHIAEYARRKLKLDKKPKSSR